MISDAIFAIEDPSASSKSPRRSRCTTGRSRSFSASTPCAHPKQPQCASRITPTRCAVTESCTWSARATSPPPCRSRSQCCVSLRPAEGSGPTGRSSGRRHPSAHQTVVGTVLAIAAGHYAGATYLLVGADVVMAPEGRGRSSWFAVLGSMLLAWITTLGTTARLDPEHLRAE